MFLGIVNHPQADEREGIPLLHQAGKSVFALRGHFAKQREILGKRNFQSRKLPVVDGVRFRGEDALRFVQGDARRKCLVRDGDMLGDIRDHLDALMEIFVEQVGTQLRIKNPGGKNDER